MPVLTTEKFFFQIIKIEEYRNICCNDPQTISEAGATR